MEYTEEVEAVFEKYHAAPTPPICRRHARAVERHCIIRSVIASTLSSCFTDVSTWCAAKRLQLNASKTKVMWFGTAAGLRKLSAGSGCIYAGVEIVEPVSVVQNLGV